MIYDVTVDGKTLYNVHLKEFKIINPVVELEQNGLGSFTFQITNTNPRFNEIKVHKSIIEVKGKEMLFYGRVLEVEDDSYDVHSVYCEGALGYFCDTIIDPYTWKGNVVGLLEKFINEHNAQVEPEKQFRLGIVTVRDPNDYISRSDTQYVSTWQNIKSKLLEKLGGYIQLRIQNDVKYIDYLSDLNNTNTQKIEFGENLLSVKKTKSYAEIATIIKPLGAKDESGVRLTIASVNSGKDCLEDAAAIAQYGRITKTVLYDDVTEPKNLLNKGKKDLLEAVKMTYSIEVSALDLAQENFTLNKKIGVISHFHGIDDYFVPQKLKVNLLNPSDNKIELNSVSKTLTDNNNDLMIQGDTVLDIVENVKADYEINVPKKITQLKNEMNSKIEQTAKEINLSVDQKFSNVTTDIDTLKKRVYVVSFTSQWGIGTETTPPTTWSDQRPTPKENEYLWMREKYLYSDGTIKTDGERMISAQKGLDGKGIVDIRSKYAVNQSNSQAPTSGWQDTVPTKTSTDYLWRKEIIFYTDNTNLELAPVCISGERGTDATVKSPTPPQDTNTLWFDTTTEILKYYDGQAWVAVNEEQVKQEIQNQVNNSVTHITNEYKANIEILQKEINSRVNSINKIVNENSSSITSLTSEIKQNSSSVAFITSQVEEFNNSLNGLATKAEIEQMMKFENGILTINASNSEFSMKLSTSELGFYQGTNKVAWINNNELHITNAIVTNGIVIGEGNNRLVFQYEGVNGWSLI